MRERAFPWTEQGPVYLIDSRESRALFTQLSRNQEMNLKRAAIQIIQYRRQDRSWQNSGKKSLWLRRSFFNQQNVKNNCLISLC